MDESLFLAKRFEQNRSRLRAMAYRMLGSLPEAEDAVQEAWLRLSKSDAAAIENLDGWLTTVVGRVSLDMLRSRRVRRDEVEPLDDISSIDEAADPEREALLADSVGPALLVLLETLTPAERLAFVLHDLFAVPFAEIAPILGRSPAAVRQLASRARRRVQGASPTGETDRVRHRRIVEAFLAASRGGDLKALVALLDPDVTLRADAAAVRAGASEELRGAHEVAATFSGRARVAQPALVNGVPGAVWAPGGRPRVVFDFKIAHDRIIGIDLIAEPERLGSLDLEIMGA